MSPKRHSARIAIMLLILAGLSGCGDKAPGAPATAGAKPPPPEVSVLTVAAERLVLITELPGRLEAARVAQVRARVAGIVLQRTFREGSDVKANELLFRINPASFQATVNSAQATL